MSNDRIPEKLVVNYLDDSLSGYGEEEWKFGGKDLKDQQRGLILPIIEASIQEEESKNDDSSIIVEIGTGNGDISSYLAKKYSAQTFTGIDFSVATAQRKHGHIKNLTFMKGYALDILENHSIQGDIVFASSTFILFTPKELKSYIALIKQNGFSQIILNEPTWGGYIQNNNDDVVSKHLEKFCWHHNYCGYLKEAGYVIKDFNYFHYNHPISTRPDIFVALIRAGL